MSHELKKRLLVTLGVLFLVRVLGHVPLPGVNGQALLEFFKGATDPLWGSYLGSPGAFRRTTLTALSLMPYLVASSLTTLIFYLWKFRKGVDERATNIHALILGLTVLISFLHAYGIAVFLEKIGPTASGQRLVPHPGWEFRLLIVITLTTSTLVLVWLAHIITSRGIGNGVCVILVMGYVSKEGLVILRELRDFFVKGREALPEILLFVLIFGMVCLSVYIIRSKWKLPLVVISKNSKQRGAKLELPLYLNGIGVFPVKIATFLLFVFITVLTMFPGSRSLANGLSPDSPYYWLILGLFIVANVYFWLAVAYNPRSLLHLLNEFGLLEVNDENESDTNWLSEDSHCNQGCG